MKPANNKIIVRVDLEQKGAMKIGDTVFATAMAYEVNYREKSPVVAQVVEGNDVVKEGQYLLCHHNSFYLPSPYHLYDDLFSIPFGKTIFAIIQHDGELQPVCENILCDRVDKEYILEMPVEQREKYLDRVTVRDGGWSPYKIGDLLFTRPYSFYEIVYMFDGHERRIHKVHAEMVVGVVKEAKV
jgi:hypothetical protein